MPPQARDNGRMPRVESEVSLLSAGSEATNSREYRVRKSSLIGYVLNQEINQMFDLGCNLTFYVPPPPVPLLTETV